MTPSPIAERFRRPSVMGIVNVTPDSFTHRILRPRETYVCALQPARLDLEPGRYELHAYLTSTIRVETRRALLVSG